MSRETRSHTQRFAARGDLAAAIQRHQETLGPYRELGDKSGIRRFGNALVPLDEALAQAVVDVSGGPICVHAGEPTGQEYVLIGGSQGVAGVAASIPYSGSLTRHIMETLAVHAQICLHLTVISGRDPHHIVECQFKALARALRDAIAFDPRRDDIPSTKGTL